MKSDDAPGAPGQVLDQSDDAGFDRHVERGRRLVEDQEARVDKSAMAMTTRCCWPPES